MAHGNSKRQNVYLWVPIFNKTFKENNLHFSYILFVRRIRQWGQVCNLYLDTHSATLYLFEEIFSTHFTGLGLSPKENKDI